MNDRFRILDDLDAAPPPQDFQPEVESEIPPEKQEPVAKGPQAFRDLVRELGTLGDQLAWLLLARVDRARNSLQRLMLALALGLVGMLVVATSLITSTVLAIVGMGEGLGQLFDGRMWLGYLLSGLVLLSIMAVTCVLAVRRLTRTSYERTVDKYARRAEQRVVRSGGAPNKTRTVHGV